LQIQTAAVPLQIQTAAVLLQIQTAAARTYKFTCHKHTCPLNRQIN
jgi:hypothetical protein